MKNRALLLFLVATSASGFTTENDARWPAGLVAFQSNLPPYDTVVASKFGQWLKYSNQVQLFPYGTPTSYAMPDQRNTIVWSSTTSLNLPSNVLAATSIYYVNNVMMEADIVVNSSYNFSSYDGSLHSPYDIGRVLLHEIGHTLGLGHSTSDAIMAPSIGNRFELAQDDIDGMHYLYGGGPTGRLKNISTRALVEAGERVMIAGIIVEGSESVVVRAIGPSLGTFGITNPLVHPQLELRDAQGALVAPSGVVPLSLQPPSADDVALSFNLPAGNYTAILSGANQSSGVALVEVYELW